MGSRYCPLCGSRGKTFRVKGDTEWSLSGRYGCDRCQILFNVEARETSRKFFEATGSYHRPSISEEILRGR